MSDFPFDDKEKLESEEDALPEIPEWPTLIKYDFQETPDIQLPSK